MTQVLSHEQHNHYSFHTSPSSCSYASKRSPLFNSLNCTSIGYTNVPRQEFRQQQSLPPSLPISNDAIDIEEATANTAFPSGYQLNPHFTSKYALHEELGSGGFGFVISAIRISDGVEVAVKFIIRHKIPNHGWVYDPEVGPIPMEIYILRHVRHENIIGYLDFFQDDLYFYLVMEIHGTPWSKSSVTPFAKNGQDQPQLNVDSPDCLPLPAPIPAPMVRRSSCDLFECIENNHDFTETQAKFIFRQIVDCVYYLNKIGICHRDIKDENIVIDSNLRLKLIDFGSAVSLDPRGRLFDGFYGTISFASPEILCREPYRAEPAEIWSLGILLYTILFGQVPFRDPIHVLSGPCITPNRPVSRSCIHLLDWMLKKRWSQRATIAEVCAHSWFRETEPDIVTSHPDFVYSPVMLR